jgi:hypothetical protein
VSALDALLAFAALLMAARAILLLGIGRRIPRLRDIAPLAGGAIPSVSICCAARDEAAHVEAAARSWLAQDLPSLEVIVVDDRSRDATSPTLKRLAAEDARLVPLRVDERPPDWLGKCHALSLAARRARGEWLLFTDADVQLAPTCVRRALALAAQEDADVVTVLPEVESDSALQHALTVLFFHFFLTTLGGRRPNADDGRCNVGIGAFLLVRKAAYAAAGGHDEVRLQVGDDVALARQLVRQGDRHRLLSGTGQLGLRWQRGVAGLIRGLEKNFFWGARFSVPLMLFFSAAALFSLLPCIAPLVGGAPAWWSLAVFTIATALPYRASAHAARGPVFSRERSWILTTLLHPVAMLLLVATGWNSMLRTLTRGGIAWRGDVVPLEELRAALKPWHWWYAPVPARPAAPGSGGST